MHRILVVDDNPVTLLLIASLLGRSGHEVVTASDGLQAMRLFAKGGFDLVITDIIMPEQDGLATIRQIRSIHATVPILTMSGNATALHPRGYLGMTLNLGASDTLCKPLDLDTLSGKVAKLLAIRAPQPELACA